MPKNLVSLCQKFQEVPPPSPLKVSFWSKERDSGRLGVASSSTTSGYDEGTIVGAMRFLDNSTICARLLYLGPLPCVVVDM